MKRTLFLALILVTAALLLSACTGTGVTTSWPGLTVSDGTAYISNGTVVRAVDYKNGIERWSFPAEPKNTQFFYAAPAVTKELLVVGDYTNVLHAVSPDTGVEQWTFAQAKRRWIGSATILEDSLLAANTDGNLYHLDLRGKILWTAPLEQQVWTHPLVHGETVILAGLDKTIFGLDLATGGELWRLNTDGAVVSTPLMVENMLYIGTFAKDLEAWDIQTGKQVWKATLDGIVWGTPLLVGETLYIGDQTGAVYAVSAKDGRFDKIGSVESPIVASPLLVNERIVIVAENGTITAFNTNGTSAWSTTVKGSLYTTPVFDGENLVVAVKDGEFLLVVLDADGKVVRPFAPAK